MASGEQRYLTHNVDIWISTKHWRYNLIKLKGNKIIGISWIICSSVFFNLFHIQMNQPQDTFFQMLSNRLDAYLFLCSMYWNKIECWNGNETETGSVTASSMSAYHLSYIWLLQQIELSTTDTAITIMFSSRLYFN